MAEIPPILLDVKAAELAKLDLRPGDTLVLHVDGLLSAKARVELRQALKVHFPDHACLVLDQGLRLEVVRAPEPDGTVGDSEGR